LADAQSHSLHVAYEFTMLNCRITKALYRFMC